MGGVVVVKQKMVQIVILSITDVENERAYFLLKFFFVSRKYETAMNDRQEFSLILLTEHYFTHL